MTVKAKLDKDGKRYRVFINGSYPDGKRYRKRKLSPVAGKVASERWGEQRQASLLAKWSKRQSGPQKTAPTLAGFAPGFFEYLRGEKYKPSGIYAKFKVLRRYLLPLFGTKRLSEITQEDVDALKSALKDKKPSTVNTVLALLRKMLDVAVRWKMLETLPFRIEFLKVEQPPFAFYDFGEFTRLVQAAAELDIRALVVVLLGGDAGLRRGEILALRWSDIELPHRVVHVNRTTWRDIDSLPKSGKRRTVPLTRNLHRALSALCNDAQHGFAAHPNDDHVLKNNPGLPARIYDVFKWMKAAQKIAGLRATGGVHILRHTFCSRLAMKGVPVKVIQEYAGHANIMTTLRYMHLSPSAKKDAIKVLDDADESSAEELADDQDARSEHGDASGAAMGAGTADER